MDHLHFRPPLNWINDPNGLVFHDGRYHLYFQYNPLGADHGNMSWGHASSPDLLTWEDHPVAISFDDDEDIFSGSIVIDHEATAGFGSPERPALVAFYTSQSKRRSHQAQSIAYSVDGGMTFTKYAGNPVLDRGTTDFRDPKVIRYSGEQGDCWVMVAVEALDRQVLFYRSDDLLTWTFLSAFGPAGAVGGVWECPDLFPLQVEGSDDVAWVLLVSLNPGGLTGGSGTQYFVGQFDGVTFMPNREWAPVEADDASGLRAIPWVDHGHDCYAGVTFFGLPDADRTLIAWMNNWKYAFDLPVDPAAPQRGAMTLARRLSLAPTAHGPVLRQRPIGPNVRPLLLDTGALVAEPGLITDALPPAGRVRLSAPLGPGVGITLALGERPESALTIEVDGDSSELTVDRSARAGHLPADFAPTTRLRLARRDTIELDIWFDEVGIEVFADDGLHVVTNLAPAPPGPRLWVSGQAAQARVEVFGLAD